MMNSLRRVVAVVFVTPYLALVLLLLLTTRQLSAVKTIRFLCRRKFYAKVSSFRLQSGFCWQICVPDNIMSDSEGKSKLVVCESGRALGPPHSSHDEIRKIGGGRFVHWGNTIYFSTSDNSDPNLNGRLYEIREE